jgi:hypothetical protein
MGTRKRDKWDITVSLAESARIERPITLHELLEYGIEVKALFSCSGRR